MLKTDFCPSDLSRFASLSLLIAMAMPTATNCQAQHQPLFIGTQVNQQGIYASTLDLATGQFGTATAVGDAPRPGFLALHPRLPLLYAITAEQKRPSGGLRSFEIDLKKMRLTLLDQQSTGDNGATHLALDSKNQSVLIAHYGGGSTARLPLNEAGRIQSRSELIKHTGNSQHPQRQKKPYAHGIAIASQGKFICVADLGTDEVLVYQLLTDGKLQRHSAWKSAPGAGPRHVVFHPNQRWLYSINELNSTLSVLNFDQKQGKLSELQTLKTLPAEFKGTNSTAEVVVHPNGKFLYCSNRGHNSTAVFSIQKETGELTRIETVPTQGDHPRFIGIEPSGQYLLAANRDSDNLVSFKIDQETGKLTPTGHSIKVPQPLCIVFPQPLRPKKK